MRKKAYYIFLIVVLFVIGFFIARNTEEEIETINRTQILLGTVVDIQVRDADQKLAEDAISKAFTEIKRIENLFRVIDQGEIWELNQKPDSLLPVDDEIYTMMVLSDSLHKLSSGSFDASMGALINLWGFDKKSPVLPSPADIKKALLNSGWDKVKLRGTDTIFRKAVIKFDFNAAAKGYAVDQAVEVLKKAGIKEALVNAGGEIKATGGSWIIGVQHPRQPGNIIKKIRLDDMSVATSGDYENYFIQNGTRYHHLLDPKTGYPSKGIQSVTIINKDNSFADGLATAVFIMGKISGIKLIESLPDTEAMIIDDEGEIYYSSGFEDYIIN